MFGSTNPFGQSSTTSTSPFGQPSPTSPFGQSSFGQTTNPFAPKPFGSPTTTPSFGAQSGTSIFGGTSTGVFGQSSTPLFGSSSTPAFGASSTPAFGSASSSLFGQKPAFGGFGSSPTQSSSPFGSTFQQTQPAFGTTAFGSTPAFGAALSTPTFGAASTPAFGAASTPAFGASSTPAFGSTSTSLFGNTTGAFGASSTPAFGTSTTPLFGASSTPAFGASSTPAFGASNTPAFGASSTPAFGAASTPSFSFGSTPAFGQTGSTFGSTPFGAQSSAFGAQTTTPTFGSSSGFGQQTGFGAQGGGSRLTPFTPTPEEGASSTGGQIAKLESISAMPAYKDKSHEELRWEDYQRGDKGGPNPNPASAFGQTAPTQQSPFGATGAFGQPAASNPFSSSTPSNPFGPKASTPTFGSTGFGSTTTTPLFGSASSSPFSSSTSFGATTTTPSIFGTPSSAAAPSFSSSSLFGATSTPAFGSSTFGAGAATGSNPFGAAFGGTQSSGLFQSPTPSFGQNQSPFGQPSTATGFQQTTPAFGSTTLNTPSTGFGGSLFSNSTSSLFPSTTPSVFGQNNALSTPFQPAAPAQSSGAFSFGNFGQTQSAGSGGFGFGSTFGQNAFGQSVASQGGVAVQPVAVTNPFGALPAMPTMSIGRVGSTPSVQYGISSMPVSEKASAGITRTSSMLVPRHLSQRRIKLPPRRYPSKMDGPKVPYFADEDEIPSTPKADAFLIPRENPRSLILRPIEQWPPHSSPDVEVLSTEDGPATDNPNGRQEEEPSAPDHREPLAEHTDRRGTGKGGMDTQFYNNLEANGRMASNTTTTHGGTSVRLPKLSHGDYYTVPRISELGKREQEEPGYCRQVKDFVVGREGYGSIMFYGETDVSGLDLDAIVEFGNREVVVYRDESSKPPVGQGLNKAAEVTLLNVKWVNKKTGQQYLEPDRVRKYTEMLKAKSVQQGAHFISYRAPQGEWKFKVDHF